jgi:hypothetical protein
MKTFIPNHDEEFQLGGIAKSHIQKILDRSGDLGNLCGRPRHRSDLADEYSFALAFLAIAHVDRRGALIFFVYASRRCARRQGRSSRACLLHQPFPGLHRRRPCPVRVGASSQSLSHSGLRFLHRHRVCSSCAGLDFHRAPGRFRRGAALSGDSGQFTAEHRGNYRPGLGWSLGPACRSEFRFCRECRLLPPGYCGDSAVATSAAAGKTSNGKLSCILSDDRSLRSQRPRISGRFSPKFPVRSIRFSDSGADAGRRIEGAATQFLPSGPVDVFFQLLSRDSRKNSGA